MGGGGLGGDGGGAGVAAAAAAAAAVMVKRALLADITRLCVFFGFENTLDSILPQLITFLNDRCASSRVRPAPITRRRPVEGRGSFGLSILPELHIRPLCCIIQPSACIFTAPTREAFLRPKQINVFKWGF